jgi:hypothetical protein
LKLLKANFHDWDHIFAITLIIGGMVGFLLEFFKDYACMKYWAPFIAGGLIPLLVGYFFVAAEGKDSIGSTNPIMQKLETYSGAFALGAGIGTTATILFSWPSSSAKIAACAMVVILVFLTYLLVDVKQGRHSPTRL